MSNPFANIQFNEHGVPFSSEFDDIYFSNQNGAEESHYVFIDKSQLQDKLQQPQTENLTIAETGFGTGLNFMVAVSLYLDMAKENTTLVSQFNFISFEKYPLNSDDFNKAAAQWPQFSHIYKELLPQYEQLLTGDRVNLFNGKVTVQLVLGDVNKTITTQNDNSVDVWFLDGFAPSKNPDMWQDNLFKQVARLSKTGATLATFTAAGFVRRGLAEHGFVMKKHKGFGHKREMLSGVKG